MECLVSRIVLAGIVAHPSPGKCHAVVRSAFLNVGSIAISGMAVEYA